MLLIALPLHRVAAKIIINKNRLLENITVKREILTLVNNMISNEILVKKIWHAWSTLTSRSSYTNIKRSGNRIATIFS